jgi:hypothetical protein
VFVEEVPGQSSSSVQISTWLLQIASLKNTSFSFIKLIGNWTLLNFQRERNIGILFLKVF